MERNRKVFKGFTLIELLVVIAIIALLAAILMPSLASARESAKGASCISNLHNAGMGLTIYANTYRGFFPTAYRYVDGNSSAGGYWHWTAGLNPDDYTTPVNSGKYPKNSPQFVCPSHKPGGFAPTNFTSTRIPEPPAGQAAQSSTIDDKQAPRLSYVANEAIMPRKKFSRAKDLASPPGTSNLCQVTTDEIESPEQTILLGEFSDSANCIYGNSVGGGAAYKSHRPTNGVKTSTGVFDGEGYATGTEVFKLTFDEAIAAINAVLADKSAGATNHHISYINPNAHKKGSNYAFTDGHAANYSLEETLDSSNYMWGRKVYSCVDKPVIQDNPAPTPTP